MRHMVEGPNGRRDPVALMAEVEHIVGSGTAPEAAQDALAGLRQLLQAMDHDGTERDQPMREIPARLGDKWSSLLLHVLRTGAFRHSVLQRLISLIGAEGSISQRMLTLRLRALERDGLIQRRVIDTHPPGVEYALTDMGRSLMGQIEELQNWIRRHRPAIEQARSAFAALNGPEGIEAGDGE
ncbi:MAG: helix-turn-helix domain-containing protein [Steroidobacteraceae bacterium]